MGEGDKGRVSKKNGAPSEGPSFTSTSTSQLTAPGVKGKEGRGGKGRGFKSTYFPLGGSLHD